MSSVSDDVAPDLDAPRSRGKIRTAGSIFLLPFRLVGGVIGLAIAAVILFVRIVTVPLRLAVALVRRLVGLAASIVYAIGLVISRIVKIAVGTAKLLVRTITATVGGVIRLILKLVGTVLKVLFHVFTFGTRIGAKKAALTAATDADTSLAAEAAIAATAPEETTGRRRKKSKKAA